MRVVVLMVGLLAACRGAPPAADDGAADIQIDRGRQAIRSGHIGLGRWEADASYVLVSARNPTDRDLMVTLRGDLIEGDARHELLPESLRLPAGAERVFALVDRGQAVRPGATAAEVVVAGALAVDYPPPIAVSEGNVYQDQGRAVVAAKVSNTGATEATATVLAAFFDADGRPLERPFTVVKLAGGGARGVQLVGPPGSTTAQLYVGEVVF